MKTGGIVNCGASFVRVIIGVVIGVEMSEELKPCPFCGGQAIMKIQKHIPNGYDYTPTCQNPSCAGRLTKKWINEDDAIKAWNSRSEPERKIIRCEDCIYFDPAHVEKDGLRYEYKDMPEEAYGPFGIPGCVTVKYGINVGSRCTCEQDKLVFRQRNDFCSRAEMRGES